MGFTEMVWGDQIFLKYLVGGTKSGGDKMFCDRTKRLQAFSLD